jgi:hypothetical protein
MVGNIRETYPTKYESRTLAFSLHLLRVEIIHEIATLHKSCLQIGSDCAIWSCYQMGKNIRKQCGNSRAHYSESGPCNQCTNMGATHDRHCSVVVNWPRLPLIHHKHHKHPNFITRILARTPLFSATTNVNIYALIQIAVLGFHWLFNLSSIKGQHPICLCVSWIY